VCLEGKDLESFYKSKKGLHGRKSDCKICCRDRHKEWVNQNPNKVAEIDKRYARNNPGKKSSRKKAWLKRHPEVVDARRLKKRYGMSMDQYRALFKHQGDSCALCKRHKTVNDLGLHVDHNHDNQRVRGLLCPSCNQALGLLQDNPELCKLAAGYLINDGKWIEHILNSDRIIKHEETSD
jgi:hypothetical protein